MKKYLISLFSLAGCIAFNLINNIQQLSAQITPDNTLGTQVNLNGTTYNITGGIQAGNNLFHSFSLFDINTNDIAHFNNNTNIVNIINRVTGNTNSNINGTIQANGSANVFLINPHGITFGSDARLNIGGSFFATTGNGLIFGNLGNFEQNTTQQQTALLTISPSALLYNQIGISIINDGILEVKNGKNIVLVGGDILSTNGKLLALGGNIEIGGLKQPGIITLNEFTLTYPEDVIRGNVILSGTEINVKSGGNGHININANYVDLFNFTNIQAGIESGLGTLETVAGNITINAQDSINLDRSYIKNIINNNAVGSAGNININADELLISNNSSLSTSVFGQGNAGNITINAQNNVNIDNSYNAILSRVEKNGIGNSGQIEINTSSLLMSNNSRLSTSVDGQGNGGNITINAEDTITIDNSSAFSTINANAIGNAGTIIINTGNLEINNNSVLSTNTLSEGNAGNITINAQNNVNIDNSYNAILSRVEKNGIGNSGQIEINTSNLLMSNNSRLSTSVDGQGNGGNITINAEDTMKMDNSSAFSTINANAIGNAGTIIINTGNLEINNNSVLSTNTLSEGNAGNITINAQNNVTINNSSNAILSRVEEFGIGNSGQIEINTGNLSMSNDSRLSTGVDGQGNGGNIIINAEDTITMDSSSVFSSLNEYSTGNAGTIIINTKDLFINNDSTINTNTLSEGNAGNITINAQNNVNIDDSDNAILSRVEEFGIGNSGQIEINTSNLLMSNNSRLSTGVDGQGNGGNIIINAEDTITMDSSSVFSSLNEDATGNAGTIIINTKDLFINNDSTINTDTFSEGNAGNITINVQNNVNIDDSNEGILSRVGNTGIGNSGQIEINTDNLLMMNNSRLSTSTEGQGNAGKITIIANNFNHNNSTIETKTTTKGKAGNINFYVKDKFNLINSSIGANTSKESTGNGGSIFIDPVLINLENSQIAVNSQGTGKGGDITIIGDILKMNNSVINAETASNQGGVITLKIGKYLLLTNTSKITATAGTEQSGGDGGDIIIDTPFIIGFLSNSNHQIIANAFTGQGGDILINTNGIFGVDYIDITASSQEGPQGIVEINTPGIDPASGLTQLPSIPIDISALIKNSCQVSQRGAFTVTGKGGLSPVPTDLLESNLILPDLGNKFSLSNITREIKEITLTENKSNLQEVQGWFKDDQGRVILTLKPLKVISQSLWLRSLNCQ